MKMEPVVSSETSALRTQTPGNYPKRNKLHLEHGESLKKRMVFHSYISKLEYLNKSSYTYFFMASRFLRLICVFITLYKYKYKYKLTSQSRSLCTKSLNCPLRFLSITIQNAFICIIFGSKNMQFSQSIELDSISNIFYIHRDVKKVKQSHYRPVQAQRVPGS